MQAALDVFNQEPPPADSPLVNRPDVVCTPHLGASTTEAQEGVAVEIADAVIGALKVATPPPCLPFPSLILTAAFTWHQCFMIRTAQEMDENTLNHNSRASRNSYMIRQRTLQE